MKRSVIMRKTVKYFALFSILALFLASSCRDPKGAIAIKVYPDSVINDVSNHPIGINLDYFMDDDHYLKPERSTADALKTMGVRYLRYPGGNKSDFYFFSVPPYEESIPTLARTGRGAVGGRQKMLKNYSEFAVDVLDFDEFMAMCNEVGAEPVLCVAADEYLVDYPEGATWASREELIQHAVEWVRYANIKKEYGVKYWMIGNESWHEQNTNSTPEIYAQDVIEFSKAMKAVDPSIFVIPNGNNIRFSQTVLEMAGDYIDMLCISNYSIYNYMTGYATYRDTLHDLVLPVHNALKALENAGLKDQVSIIVAEYGPFDWGNKWPMINDMGHNLCNFEMTGELLLVPEVDFSLFWNTRWIDNELDQHSAFDALDRHGNFNANGMGLMIWGNYLRQEMVKTTSTLHLRTFASYTPADKNLCVYIINKSPEPQSIDLDIKAKDKPSQVSAMELVGEGPDDVNPVWQECDRGKDPTRFNVKGTSITVVEYRLK
jgi:alpha-N-arabinofuranosidase